MNKDQIRMFLGHLGAKVPNSQNRGGWIVSNCPLGHWRHEGGESSGEVFGVKIESGDCFCNCFACAWHGTQSDLIIEMRRYNKIDEQGEYDFKAAMELIIKAEETMDLAGLDSPDIEEMLFGKQTGDHIFADWWFNSFQPWHKVKFAQDYLAERGIHPKVCDILDIRADTEQNRVCFPVRDFEGRLRGLHGRAVNSTIEPRYRMYTQAGKNNPQIWLGEDTIDLDRPVVVVEGPMDLAKVRQVYDNVASPLFSNPNFLKIKRISDAIEVVTFLDIGTGGSKGRGKLEDGLKHSVVRHALPPANYSDPGEMPFMDIAELLSDFVPIDESAIIK